MAIIAFKKQLRTRILFLPLPLIFKWFLVCLAEELFQLHLVTFFLVIEFILLDFFQLQSNTYLL